MFDFTESMHTYLQSEIQVIEHLNLAELNQALNAIVEARARGGTVYTMGNGGSSATASHMVCDFAKGASDLTGGKKFLFECLNDHTPLMTAIANDIDYKSVFYYQLRGKLKPGDLVIAISGSGNSGNVIRAVRYAREIGTPVIGITGYDGGELRKLCDYPMHVPVDDMQIAEDLHMVFDHMLLRAIEQTEALREATPCNSIT